MGTDIPKSLIYYIYFNGKVNFYHKLNLELLSQYWNVFNGQKIVKIAVDRPYSIKPITDLLPKDCVYEVVKNNSQLGEADYFLDSLNQIDTGYVFYAHCKGVSRPYMEGLNIWINHLYKANLHKFKGLNGKMFSGTCCKLLPCPPYVPESFHFSGSFYWMDIEKVKPIFFIKGFPVNRYLTERFPAFITKVNECNLIEPVTDKPLNFYLENTWDYLKINSVKN